MTAPTQEITVLKWLFRYQLIKRVVGAVRGRQGGQTGGRRGTQRHR